MGRYRPPQSPGSPYITPEGYAALQDELDSLWPHRREVTRALAAAAAEGDRSENAEYIYRKKELHGIDRRIRYLQKRLPDLEIVDLTPSDPQQIFFGAWVTLEDKAGVERQYRIVGPDEIDPHRGLISMDAPMARALMKQRVNDDVEVQTPQGRCRYFVVAVSYSSEQGEG
jgi:transcription elongation factor GreB